VESLKISPKSENNDQPAPRSVKSTMKENFDIVDFNAFVNPLD
jgi:hypothetical protein